MAQAPGESRRRIMGVALRLFGERGYGGTALQAIADELGLTKASVYHYFRAKADLLDALADPCLVRLEAIIVDPPDPSAPANCRALLDAYLATLADFSVVAELLIGDPTVSTHPAALRCRSLRGTLRDLLARAGSPPVGPVPATCCLGAVQSAVFDLPTNDAVANRSTILDAAMRALGGPPTGSRGVGPSPPL